MVSGTRRTRSIGATVSLVAALLVLLPVTATAGVDDDGDVDAVFAIFSAHNRACLGDGAGTSAFPGAASTWLPLAGHFGRG